VSLAVYGGGQVVSGHLGDRLGGRRMIALGAVLSCGFNWLTSFGRGFWALLASWSLNSVAQSMGFAPGSRLIANWWGPRERGRAFGVYTCAAGCSSVLTFVFAILVLERLGWVWVFRLPVLLMPMAGLLCFALVRDRPAEMGFPAPRGVAAGPEDAPGSIRDHAGEVLGNRRFLIASLGFGFNNWARLGLLVWVPAHFLGPGWRENPGAAWITLALPVGMALGALAAGYGADRFFRADQARLITPLLALASLVTLAMVAVPRDQRVLGTALLFLAGFLVFGPTAAYTTLGAELTPRRMTGTAVGVMSAAGYGAAALGDLVTGAVTDLTGRTDSVFLITAGACLAGAACSLVVRRVEAGQP
jgi:OPA family glycerol-3-phosphate transporter-like MFS transporter